MSAKNISKPLSALVIFLSISVLGGCAASYKAKDVWGGFSETQIKKNVFEVSFKGNSFTTRERVKDFSLLRSAEVALENGYDYFVVIEQTQSRTLFQETTPMGFTAMSSYGGHGGQGRAATGGRKDYVSNPVSDTIVACFNEKPENVTSYNARQIVNEIKTKYALDKVANRT